MSAAPVQLLNIPYNPSGDQKGSLVIVQMVYHRCPGREVDVTESRFSVGVASNDRTYQQRLGLTETWVPVPDGWVNSAWGISLRNEREPQQVIPTQDKKDELRGRVVELGVMTPQGAVLPIMQIPMGEEYHFPVLDVDKLRLRCPNPAGTWCVVKVYPK